MKAETQLRYRYVVLVVLALALAGCGGGDKVPSVADDKARAERIVFTDADIPDLEREDDDEDDDEDDPFRQCLNGNQMLTDLGDGPRSAEVAFSDEEETQTRASSVNLAEKEDEAEEAFAELERTSFLGCFENAIRTGIADSVGPDVEIDDLSVSELPAGELGDDSVGYRATLDLIGEEDEASFALDYLFFRVGRGIAIVFSFDINDTLDAGERDRLAKILVDRMEKEL